MCDEPPAVHSPSEAKAAAYLMRKHRDVMTDILELEVSYYTLTESVKKTLKRAPDPMEVVVLQVDRRTGGQDYKIERDLPELTAAERKTHAREVDAATAAEWTSWNDHGSFRPQLRSTAKNVIDCRWLYKWKIVDGKKVVKARLCARGFKSLFCRFCCANVIFILFSGPGH